MSSARESVVFSTDSMLLRAAPATKTTEDLVGDFMPWVPRFGCSVLELVRNIWWCGSGPVNLRKRDTL